MAKYKEQNATLRRLYEGEREKVSGYEQLAQLHVAYIAVLIGRLGATKDNPITITTDDVAKAMKAEVRGYPEGEGFKLYIE